MQQLTDETIITNRRPVLRKLQPVKCCKLNSTVRLTTKRIKRHDIEVQPNQQLS